MHRGPFVQGSEAKAEGVDEAGSSRNAPFPAWHRDPSNCLTAPALPLCAGTPPRAPSQWAALCRTDVTDVLAPRMHVNDTTVPYPCELQCEQRDAQFALLSAQRPLQKNQVSGASKVFNTSTGGGICL